MEEESEDMCVDLRIYELSELCVGRAAVPQAQDESSRHTPYAASAQNTPNLAINEAIKTMKNSM